MEIYFAGNLYQTCEIEKIIKKRKEETSSIQIVVREAFHIKRLTWFLLKEDIAFERKSLGSGITAFFIDLNIPFFTKEKTGNGNNE